MSAKCSKLYPKYIKYFWGLIVLIIPFTFAVFLKFIYEYLPGNKIGSIEDWISFSGGYIGALLALGGVWWQIKYNENKKKKNFKNYILEITNWNLDKITNENLEIQTLNLLTFSRNYTTIKDLDLDTLYLFNINDFSEANSIMINLGIGLEVQNLNSNINIYNKLMNKIKTTEENDFFYSLEKQITLEHDSKLYKNIKLIDLIIRNNLYFLLKKEKFILLEILEQKFLEFCDSLINDENCMIFYGEEFINEILEYKEKEKDINFIYKMFDIICINLNKLSYSYGNKFISRELNIELNEELINFDNKLYKFLNSKSNEIRVIKNLLPTITKDLNNLKNLLNKKEL